jgi:oxepin-CoA hydrolase/3-oxo-5,6-dehydrosuberyl-CoA semialdehyde dehydrogenase
MQTLESYAAGRWQAGRGRMAAIENPTNEERIAETSSEGVDFGGVLAHARETGGPALRALSFGRRGELLMALSKALHERREELIEVSIENGGSTRSDAKFDLDGATGTLAAYARLGQELGDRRHLAVGEGLQLGRTARFSGRHVLVPRLGAAVHVNAFNFPAWGQMEKAACALLAGTPVIEKPGTPTALIAWRVAKAVVESGVLPEGSYQFIAGSTGDLLERLGPQDCVAFTGSSRTAAKLRGNPSLVARNVRLNVEADSLNCAILAPDVERDAESYGLFLRNVALDVRQKAGQKCTAVRRILVPAERVEEVEADLVAELARVVVGDPADDATTMGPLASRAQLADVQAGIGRLASAARTACGGAERVRERGYFAAPTLLVARQSDAAVFHTEEVFGPVATILPYSGAAADAARLAALGDGCLVSSAYSNDPKWLESVAFGLAPWHGRVWLGSDRMAEQSLPPGMVLPQLIHGGPGRAGGGEELGLALGLTFYMQRTAVQGFQSVIEGAFA